MNFINKNYNFETEMTPEQLKIIKEQIPEIREYREVLSKLFKYRVSLNQAIADWFEKGFYKKFGENEGSFKS